MSIEFEIRLPDEPFKESFDLGKKVKITYKGLRYIVIGIFNNTNQVSSYENLFNSAADINLSQYIHENKNFYVIDAYKHPLEACFITDLYDNEEVENYEETLPTGETYTYFYENKILANIYKNEMPYYNNETDTFSNLKYLEPAISKENFIDFTNRIVEMYSIPAGAKLEDLTKDLDEQSKEKMESIQSYAEWVKNIEMNYPNVDHWKIPFPQMPA